MTSTGQSINQNMTLASNRLCLSEANIYVSYLQKQIRLQGSIKNRPYALITLSLA